VTPEQTRAQVEALTTLLVELSLCDEQFFPSMNDLGGGVVVISISGIANLSIAMKNIDYRDIYADLERTKSFNFRMLDGAMMQLLYTFKNGLLDSHRLAYFPSPTLEAFQNDPEIYETDEVYADVIRRNVVSFPIRFDYSASEERHVDVRHPKSHLTLGQYQNCRIPVLAPLSPVVFVKFVLRNFYNTAFHVHEEKITVPLTFFPSCITQAEQGVPHIVLSRLPAA
jgi:hypothetical protein